LYDINRYLKDIELEEFELCDKNSIKLKKHLIYFNSSLIESIYSIDSREENIHKALEDISYFSGALSFLFLQNLSAMAYFQKLSQAKLIEINRIKYNCGIAFAHLRNTKTFVSGVNDGNDIVLNGFLPWSSGYKIFDYVLIGFHIDGQECIAFCAFSESANFIISDIMDSFVASSMNTVSIKLTNFKIPYVNIISKEELGTFNKLLGDSSRMPSLMVGIIQKGIDIIPHIYLKEKKHFNLQLSHIRESILNKHKIISTRMECFKLAQMVIGFCSIANGGKSVLYTNSIQRLYREILLFSLSGISPNIISEYQKDSINFTVKR
jgi:hypothetical protein